jgi:nucleotide-binding universal stress UspA family protein
MKILIVIHGNEPPGWARELPRVLALPSGALVRFLPVVDVPAPAFTSLTPWARRAFRAALDDWRRDAETRVRKSLDVLVETMPCPSETLWARAPRSDPARAVVEQARVWHADLVVVGPDTRPRLERLLLGSIHRSVVRDAPCGVLVWPRCEMQAARANRVRLKPA